VRTESWVNGADREGRVKFFRGCPIKEVSELFQEEDGRAGNSDRKKECTGRSGV
jgi:hypothetical protein